MQQTLFAWSNIKSWPAQYMGKFSKIYHIKRKKEIKRMIAGKLWPAVMYEGITFNLIRNCRRRELSLFRTVN